MLCTNAFQIINSPSRWHVFFCFFPKESSLCNLYPDAWMFTLLVAEQIKQKEDFVFHGELFL